MKRILFLLFFVLILPRLTYSVTITPGTVCKISTQYTGNRSLTTKDSSPDDNTPVFAWTETGTNSQRWKMSDAGNGSFFIDNVYTGKRLYPVSITSVAQNSINTSDQYKWTLTPVDGYENCYYIVNVNKNLYLELTNDTMLVKDGSNLRLNAKTTTIDPRQVWKIEAVADVPNKLTPAMRTQMMQSWKDRYYAGERVSTGFWGLAENMEVILDAYETTGKDEYRVMFEDIYKNFISKKSSNWMGNEFNDDIAWAVLASIRAYFLFGNNTDANINYLTIARTNFDNMYQRALYKVDNLYYLLRWKQGQDGTTSCVNGPAEVAACYLGLATGVETYFEKAKMLYASQRIHLYEPSSGKVYDTFSSGWASTYNQGTYLGAAVALYNHYGDEMYKKDAETIMKFTAQNLCNSNGIINVCGGEVSDLPGFKGILMRYVRKFIVDLEHEDYVNWLQKNAIHAFNNRNSQGITWTAWWEKAKEKDYTDGFGSFTAVSAAMNAPLDINTITKDAFGDIQAGSFNYISKVATENNTEGEKLEITSIKDGAYLGYSNVDCNNKLAKQVEFLVSNDATQRSVEIRLGSATGKLLATVQIPPSDNTWKAVSANLTQPFDGKNNIYLVFRGTVNGLRMKSFKFITGGSVFPDVTDNGGTIGSQTALNLANLIDNRLSTEYQCSFTAGSGVTISYNSPVPVKAISYALATGAGVTDYDPASWKLQASSDGTNWVDLDTQANQAFAERNTLKKYTIQSSASYSLFRLVISQLSGTAGKLCLSEWQLYGSSVSPDDITADGGVLSAQYADNQVNITDKSVDSKYQISEQTNFWIQYNATARYKLKRYSLTSADNSPENDPQSWILYGSTDNATWEKIDERYNQVFGDRKVTQTYLCNVTGGYKYFKVNVLSVNGGGSSQLSEWQLFGDFYFDQYTHDFLESGIITSDAADSVTLSKLKDNDPNTYCNIKFSKFPVVIIAKTKVPVQLLGYSITSTDANSATDPKAWTFYGSKDGVTWSLIENRTNETFESRYLRKNYDKANSNFYSYFKLAINATNGSVTDLNIAEWEINGLGLNAYGVTSNPGGTMTAQYDGNYDETKSIDERFPNLIDNNKLTKYLVNYRKTFWAEYQSARPARLFAYSLTSANDAVTRDPQSWTLYGSNNNSTWTVIDKQTNQVFPYRYATLYYTCVTNTKYTYYKLVVDENNGEKGVQLGEWQLFGEFNDYQDDITENGGILTASNSATDGTTLNNLIDNSETNEYYAGISSTDFGSGIWFKYQSPNPAILTSYTLTSSNDNSNNDPKDWKLQGSNDDVNWADIDTQTGVSFDSRCERKVFAVPATLPYKYFRLYVTAKKLSTVKGFQLAEWELFGTVQSALIPVKQNTLVLYPNPVGKYAVIDAPEAGLIEIINLNGESILSSEVKFGNNTLNLDNVSSGMFLVKIKSSEAVYTGKLIKK